ncbi:hypothetical protein ACRASL_08555, partial [Staphylococcus aureus]
MILVVDNYDSFTYNLVDIVAQHTDVIVQYPDDDNVLNQSVKRRRKTRKRFTINAKTPILLLSTCRQHRLHRTERSKN